MPPAGAPNMDSAEVKKWLEKLVRKWLGMKRRAVQSGAGSSFKGQLCTGGKLPIILTKTLSILNKRHPTFFHGG